MYTEHQDNYLIDLLDRRIPDQYPYVIEGRNADVDTGAAEDIWNPGATFTALSAGMAIEVISSDANDDGNPVGTGVRTVKLVLMTSAYQIVEETVTLNGVSAVETTGSSYIDLLDAYAVTVGSNGAAVGTITIRGKTGPVTMGTIAAGLTRIYNAKFACPKDEKMFILPELSASCSASNQALLELRVKNYATGLFDVPWRGQVTPNGLLGAPKVPILIPEKNWFIFRATTSADDNDISVRFIAVRKRKDYA